MPPIFSRIFTAAISLIGGAIAMLLVALLYHLHREDVAHDAFLSLRLKSAMHDHAVKTYMRCMDLHANITFPLKSHNVCIELTKFHSRELTFKPEFALLTEHDFLEVVADIEALKKALDRRDNEAVAEIFN